MFDDTGAYSNLLFANLNLQHFLPQLGWNTDSTAYPIYFTYGIFHLHLNHVSVHIEVGSYSTDGASVYPKIAPGSAPCEVQNSPQRIPQLPGVGLINQSALQQKSPGEWKQVEPHFRLGLQPQLWPENTSYKSVSHPICGMNPIWITNENCLTWYTLWLWLT